MGVPSIRLATCDRAEPALHALADGELSVDDGGAAVAALRGHVARCAACRGRWDGIIRTRQLLAAASRRSPSLPPELVASLAALG
jgi:anti-sigma factor RsiW